MVVSWFSAGVSSAVATKLEISRVDRIIYTHIDDQHPDTMRFIKDCEKWFGKPVEVMQSPLRCVNNALLSAAYVNGPHGSPCTRLLKRRVRKEWEKGQKNLTYLWGMDSGEWNRCERLMSAMPDQCHLFPLHDRRMGKQEAHEILKASGIKRPAMYDLGYNNNNCIGCVKGGKKYWARVRRDFPAIFEERAKVERVIGGTCIKEMYLDELPAEYNGDAAPIIDDCGIFCELMAI
jgi:hypothetical protein